jgi:hypothetical protein
MIGKTIGSTLEKFYQFYRSYEEDNEHGMGDCTSFRILENVGLGFWLVDMVC